MLFGPSHPNFESYEDYLQLSAALTRLFSSKPGKTPHLDPKWLEQLFCEAFKLENVASSSKSFDALQGTPKSSRIGVGLKTFLMENWAPKFEKIAEFNKAYSADAWDLSDKESLIARVADCRNKRVISDAVEYGVDPLKSIYHCVGRSSAGSTGGLLVFEEPYPLIEVAKLRLIESSARTSLDFSDGSEVYRFVASKSVLYKKFGNSLEKEGVKVATRIIDSPLSELLSWYQAREACVTPTQKNATLPVGPVSSSPPSVPGVDYLVLPLYSTRNKQVKFVPERSGLNQWNAGGRTRDFGVSHGRPFGEMYVPVPAPIRNKFRSFFPQKDESFLLITPAGEELRASLCQEGEKALMSNPNKALSSWLFSILNFTPRAERPLTYRELELVNKDAVQIDKISMGRYAIRLCPLGAYEEFCSATSLVASELG